VNKPTAAPSGDNNRSTAWFSATILALVTILAFANAAHDELVLDDKVFVGAKQLVKVDSLQEAFTRDVWGNDRPGHGFYRPLMLVGFDLQTRLFGDWNAGYHIVNIAQYVIATLLLLGFLRYLLRLRGISGKKAELAALTAAMIFAVHPVHTEVVNSVFNGSSISVSIFAIAGLWWLLSRLESQPLYAWLGFGLAYSIAILFKESALSLPGIAVALIFLLTEGTFWQRVRRFLPVFWMLVPIAGYFYLRSNALAGEATSGDEFTLMLEATQFPGASYVERIGFVLAQAMRTMFWPWPLAVFYGRPTDLTLLLGGIAWLILLASAVVLYFRGKPSLAAGLAFFLIAFLPASRLISSDGSMPHMADRYLYYPSIGFAIALAFAVYAVAKRFNPKIIMLAGLALIFLGASITWSRNHDWSNETYLFKSEYEYGNRNLASLKPLLAIMWQRQHYDQISRVCDENPEFLSNPDFLSICVKTYSQTDRREDAIAALEANAEQDEGWMRANLTLSNLLIQAGRKQEAADRFVYIINRLEQPALKEFYKGFMYLQLFPRNRQFLETAKGHLQFALSLDPELEEVHPFLKHIERILNPAENGEAESDELSIYSDMALPMPPDVR